MIIILENAINYNTLEEAMEMIQKGKEITTKTGVKTMSKFQRYNKDNLLQVEDLEVREYCRKRMLSKEDAWDLFDYGKSIGQEVFFTPMYDCIAELEEMGIEYYKIRHFDRLNWELQLPIVKSMKPTFISMNSKEDYRYIMKYANTFIPLYCVPSYPAKIEDYPYILGHYQGYSDHVTDLELLKFSMKNNIEYFERHMCLTKEGCLEAEWASTFEELEVILK